MSKILIVTVGGSCEPIVTVVNRIKADKIYFICSADKGETKGSYKTIVGEGMVCGPWESPNKPNIVKQCNLEKESYQYIELEEVDDYNSCYAKSFELISNLFSTERNPEIIVDYTGGTKSMAGGLLLAATEFPDITISVVKGERPNLIKVKDGTQMVKSTRINLPLLNYQKKQIIKLINLYDYASALELIKDTLSTPDLDKNYEINLMELMSFCYCLNDWDNFNHKDALKRLKNQKCLSEKFQNQLQNVVNSRRCIEEDIPIPATKTFSRYEIIFDLIKNAERKALQGKYDDAVGRLYRTVELLAQSYLKLNYTIDTGNLDYLLLPNEIKEEYKDKKAISLMESYKLIGKIDADSSVSFFFKKKKNNIMNALKERNYSILAHGFSPIDKEKYNVVYNTLIKHFVLPILNELTKDSGIKFHQLPDSYAP